MGLGHMSLHALRFNLHVFSIWECYWVLFFHSFYSFIYILFMPLYISLLPLFFLFHVQPFHVPYFSLYVFRIWEGQCCCFIPFSFPCISFSCPFVSIYIYFVSEKVGVTYIPVFFFSFHAVRFSLHICRIWEGWCCVHSLFNSQAYSVYVLMQRMVNNVWAKFGVVSITFSILKPILTMN